MGPALLLAAAAAASLALPVTGTGPGPARLRLFFTPPRCRFRCAGGRCVHFCQRGGNVTALESGRPPGGSGFRLVVCPLLCQNGGVCARPDSCVCPPEFTGKFCHVPANGTWGGGGVPQNPGGPQALTQSVYTLPLANYREEEDGAQSMVSIHVQHPPEAAVTIHQVERVRGGDETPPAPTAPPVPRAPRPAPLYRVLAQSSPRVPPGEERAGYGYCFRQLRGGECSSPLPGLRTQDICCRGAGVAWGVHECQPCDGHPYLLQRDAPCPQGFQRINGSCVDVDECQEGGFCQNGVCTNTRGSFACLCQPGFLLDSSRSSCISHQVISEARGPCYRVLREGRCALPTLRNITRQICCCSRVGKAWGAACHRCPPFGSEGFKEICPAGPGYHYSASDLRYNTRYLGQDLARVPLGRPRVVTAAPPATPRWQEERHPGPLPVTRMPPVPTRPPRVPERPPPAPEVIVVPRPTQGLVGPFPTLPTREGQGPAAVGSVCERNPQICGPGRCVPRQGGYTCLCHPGFWLSTQGTHCIDVDECRRSPRPCPNGRCENSVGSYRCLCSPGYRPSAAGTDCQDVDECAQSPPPCTHGRCENLPGGYRCTCPAGYRGMAPDEPCQDIDECENHLACPGQECINTPGSFQCQPCREGFQLHRGRCADVDECAVGSPCGPHGRCTNTEGSFHCECQRGYRAGAGGGPCADVNECLEGDFCFPHGECLNTEGSYTCLCAQGYTSTPQGTACADVDECQRGGVCEGGRCANTDGSFECHCPAGFRTDADKALCQDVDECQEYGASLCGAQRCDNIPGSYRCVTDCQPGYRAGDGGDCVDVDECQEYGASLCGAQRCDNIPGSYRCITDCQPGYRLGDGGDCIDVDECSNGTLCGAHATCHNLPGSFQCACDPGYETARHGHHCVDVDECETLRGVCGAERCENVEGSFLCLCPDSRDEFDPVTGRCVPPPAPQTPPQPPGTAACFSKACGVLAPNVTQQQCCCSLGWAWGTQCPAQPCPTPGTDDHLAICPHGHGRALTSPQDSPADVDECQLFGPQLCRGGVCLNASPGFSCYCPSGYYYEQEHLQCVDNDECGAEEAEPCLGGRCVNTVGSYYCSCPPPLVLDGSQRRCVANDTHLDAAQAVCWQEVGVDLVCGRPRLDRQVTYTECCCLYGQAWGMDCALCPTRHSDDFEFLCNVLRPPSYGPPRAPPSYEYAPDFAPPYGLPYGPDIYGGPRVPSPPLRSDYDLYGFGGTAGGYDPRGDPLYAPPRYEGDDFEDSRRPFTHRPRGPRYEPPDPHPGPPWSYQPHGTRGFIEEEEEDEEEEDAGEEECGVLSGCQHGRCVRVPDGFTCDCDPGYRLDPARLDCVDIDECSQAALCLPGRCLNTPGSYRCLCPPGHILALAPPRCLPTRPRA
ncbi:latent-transforming growth factor beta-binding protein 4 isoform X1 [Accipiter gentilis]|uniref:latent-transforming growth factor beta-binding protein 4 isoform X1 n=1 Tax=Astur gentilis TaxID=8957 RepID=UPI00210FC433|nr:latent-transforming growth factor beta-binding protein 4 isoform X1 [Accipiter gentilis]